MRKLVVVAAILLVDSVVGAGSLASADTAVDGKKITLIERPQPPTFVDLAPTGPGPGDRLDGETVFHDETNMHEVARSHGECVQAGSSPAVLQCAFTFLLAGRQITIQGVADFAAPSQTLAITGGTGEYNKARGEVTSILQGDGTSRLDFYL